MKFKIKAIFVNKANNQVSIVLPKKKLPPKMLPKEVEINIKKWKKW